MANMVENDQFNRVETEAVKCLETEAIKGDLISREAVLEILRKKSVGTWRGVPCYPDEISAAYREVSNLPAIEAEPVRHGRWKDAGHGLVYKCSECEHLTDYQLSKYCPNCGAKMDGGVDHD